MKRQPSDRDRYVAKFGNKVLACLKQIREGCDCRCVEYADNVELLSMEMYEGLSNVICRTFDVVSGELLEFTVLQWVRDGYYRTHSLILCGDAGLGKTPLGMSMMSEIALITQCEYPWRPYFIKIGTMDA